MTERFPIDPASVAVAPSASLPDAMGASGRRLYVEVGFGKDVRLLRAAAADPEGRYLGVEISRKKFDSFCRKAARAGLTNVRALGGDVRRVLGEMLPPGSVAGFTILFPDPWPKRRQRKNRWIQPATAASLYRALAPGGIVEVATDDADYLAQIRRCFLDAGLLLETERGQVEESERTVFASRFERRGVPVIFQRWRRAVPA
ncbi:MAG: tRNA (guanine(46)-N(7))-methyltransferase TrmB [Planctomycetaceae bacterium]